MSNWQHRNWLVTGGCGFIGGNLAQRLCQAGCRVRVFDDFSVGGCVPDDKVEVIEGDVRDREAVRAAAEGSEVVIHLAAQSGVMPSIEDPLRDFEVNAGGTLERAAGLARG